MVILIIVMEVVITPWNSSSKNRNHLISTCLQHRIGRIQPAIIHSQLVGMPTQRLLLNRRPYSPPQYVLDTITRLVAFTLKYAKQVSCFSRILDLVDLQVLLAPMG